MTGRIELHCHLDGSVRPATIRRLAAAQGLMLPGPVETLAVAPPSCRTLPQYLGYIDVALDVLQRPEALHEVAMELVEDWAGDGVGHGEVRFAPQLHQRAGLRPEEVLDAVAEGLAEGSRRWGVTTSLILCCLRHQPPQISAEVARLALDRRDVVAGLDLAGDETMPGAPHREAFDAAHAAGLPVTIHAGEAAGADSVWEALDVLGAQRIGHGVRSAEDPALLSRLREDDIVLEMCPTSNVQTGAVSAPAAHPIDTLLRHGIPVTVSTDARTVSNTTLGREFERLRAVFGWTAAQERECQDNAGRAAFRAL
ncbi:adenosine deaminase [Actinoallomurus acanthiterrae]